MILRRRHFAHAGRRALAHVMIEAGTHAVAHGPVRTAAQAEGPVDELPGFARRQRRGERPEIARPVPARAADDLQPREGMLHVQPEERILLVIAQDDIVMRPVFLDEARLKEQRLLLRGGGEIVKALGMGEHGPCLDRQPLRTEIGKHPPAQHARLAHIDDPATTVPVEVNAGRERDAGRVRPVHARILRPDGRAAKRRSRTGGMRQNGPVVCCGAERPAR